MTSLQLLWFILICVLFIVFMCLEGADFGLGITYLFIAKKPEEQEAIVSIIEPTWDGSEVWLVAAIGGMFASFPIWYGSLLSGYYLFFLFLIIGLIFRGTAIHFRGEGTPRSNRLFDKGLMIGSLLPPFLLAVIFSSMTSGIPVDAQGNIRGAVNTYLTSYTIVTGLLMVILCIVHGLNYGTLKTAGSLRSKLIDFQKYWRVPFVLLAITYGILIVLSTPYLIENPIYTIALLALLGLGVISQLVPFQQDWLKYLGSTLSIVSLMLLIISGAFPLVIVDSFGVNSIAIQEASSTPYTLQLMTKIVAVLLPIIILYQCYAFYLFRKRISLESK